MTSLIVPTRRGFITGLVSFLAAPAIVRVASLMPVRALPLAASYRVGDYVSLMTLDDYALRVMSPALEKMKHSLATSFMSGANVAGEFVIAEISDENLWEFSAELE